MNRNSIHDSEITTNTILHLIEVIETASQPEFDNILSLATQICQTPLALLTFTNKNQQYSKAQIGFKTTQFSTQIPFFAHTLAQNQPFVVTNATTDARFSSHAMVIQSPNLQFYAGVAIIMPNGQVVGILSVFNTHAHKLTAQQLAGLQTLSNQVAILLQLRLQLHETQQQNSVIAHFDTELQLRHLADNIPNSAVYRLLETVDGTVRYTFISSGIEQIIGISPSKILDNSETLRSKIYPDDEPAFLAAELAAREKLTVFDSVFRRYHANGELRWFHARSNPQQLSDGSIIWDGIITDITQQKYEENASTENAQLLHNVFQFSPIPLLISSISDGTIVMANENMAQLVGISVDELIGQKTTKFYVNIEEREILKNSIYANGSVNDLDLSITDYKGNLIQTIVSVKVITMNNEPMFFSGFIDVRERKMVEEKLRHSEIMFREMVKNVPGVVYQFRVRPDGSTYFSYLSEQFSDIFGFKLDAAKEDWSLAHYIPEEDRPTFVASIIEAINTKSKWEYRGQLMTGNGELKWVSAKSIPTQIGNELVFNGIIVDITERHKQQLELKASENQFRNLINDLTVGILVQGPQTEIIVNNKAALTLLGVTEAQLLGKTSFDPSWHVIHEDGTIFPGQLHPVSVAIATLQPVKSVTMGVFRPTTNNIIWLLVDAVPFLDANGNLEHVVVSFYDISERKKVEQALQTSEDNLDTVFENTDIGYVLLNTEKTIVSFNYSAAALTYKKNGKQLAIAAPMVNYFEKEREEAINSIWETVLVAGEIVEYDRSIADKNGELLWYHVKHSPAKNKEGKIFGILLVYENITERKKTELELKNSFNLVSEQNKRLLNFSYIVSHNLRSHTSNIKSILNFLDITDTEEEKNEMLQHLKNVSDALDETLYNLNEIVAIQNNVNIVVEPLRLIEYVNKAISVLSEQIVQKDVVINKDIPENVIVKYNPAYLESVVLNFLSNAIKYSHPNRQPIISLTCKKEGKSTILEISDNGVGIDLNRNAEKLFGMYKTFHGNTDARGIGLFISKNQIEAMGGSVSVQSKLNTGTTFTIVFK